MTKIFVCFHREHKFYIQIYPRNIDCYMPYEQMSEQKLQFVTFIPNTLSKTFNLTYIPAKKSVGGEHLSPVKATIPLRYPYQLIALPQRKDRKLKFVFSFAQKFTDPAREDIEKPSEIDYNVCKIKKRRSQYEVHKSGHIRLLS